ncbi:ABC-type transport auxiliary lipoprotein family protein [Dinoroseobacter sp. S124A]|uniref:ABC-type transport auxiliary lipoprotein family protein n=1 Tax=Dinoroseobacter sp. S124A TaxID=3415128 RepID=UPI003C79E588
MARPQKIRASALGLGLALALSGCSAITAISDASKTLEVYELRAPEIQPAGRSFGLDVVIEEPTTSGALQTDRIMIRPDPLQAQYLPGVRWSETTPVMLQTLMLRSLEQSQALRYVGRTPLGISGDVAVLTELVDFQAEVAPDGETGTVELRLISRVVRESDIRILGTRTFAARAILPSVEEAAVIAGFDQAASQLLSEHAAWVLSVLR